MQEARIVYWLELYGTARIMTFEQKGRKSKSLENARKV